VKNTLLAGAALTLLMTLSAPGAWAGDRHYLDTSGHPLTDVLCFIPDPGQGISDDTLACHSASKGGLTCKRSIFLDPPYNYQCEDWVDKIDVRTYVDTGGHILTGLKCSVQVDEQGNELRPGTAHCSDAAGKGLTCKRNVFDDFDPVPTRKYVCGAYLDKAGLPTDNPYADLVPLSAEQIEARREAALAECNKMPTTVGVLLCRWGVK
jgi:hypothetical protein